MDKLLDDNPENPITHEEKDSNRQETPPAPKQHLEPDKKNFPVGKLSVLTRKRHEIEEILKGNPSKETLLPLYTDFLVRLDALMDQCASTESNEWFEKHKLPIESFRTTVNEYFLKLSEEAKVRIPNPTLSERTKSSQSSSFILCRLNLAKDKAKLAADAQYAKAIDDLEMAQLKIKQDLRKAGLQRLETEAKFMEEELDKIENCSQQSRSSLTSDCASESRQLPFQATAKSRQQYDNFQQSNAQPEHRVRYEDSRPSTSKKYAHYDHSTPIFSLHNQVEPNINTLYSTTPNNREESLQPETLLDVLKKQNEISLALAKQGERALLPPRTLEIFNGEDITLFKTFLRKFEILIESKCANDLEKLSFLEQYTQGRARKIVQSCTNRNPTTAFIKAKELLIKEYGNQHKIASVYMDKLRNWQTIKSEDVKGLEELSVFLNKCKII